MGRLRRDALNSAIARFGIDLSDRMLQHALKGVGIRPTYEGIAGGKGKTSWFDLIDAWVIATAVFGRAGAWTSDEVRLDQLLGTYDALAGIPDAGDIPGFRSDAAYGMKLLYIAQLDGGFPVLRLQDRLVADPGLYELTRFGPTALHIWLLSYVKAYGETWAAIALPDIDNTSGVERLDLSSMRREHLVRVVEWAAAHHRALGSDSWKLDKGGDA